MTATLDHSLWARRAYSWLFVALLWPPWYPPPLMVVSFAVSQRTHEIGIRMALGARLEQVLPNVLAGGMTRVFLGTALGLVGALLTARFLQSLLFGVSAKDALIYTA